MICKIEGGGFHVCPDYTFGRVRHNVIETNAGRYLECEFLFNWVEPLETPQAEGPQGGSTEKGES